ncbi:MAG: O-antigen ligase family protein [Candidatus Eiseniibacteriota bacterium]|nr:MAG: O-antigen ligase family protein [Candidatus Eisenbacteria bacterium]
MGKITDTKPLRTALNVLILVFAGACPFSIALSQSALFLALFLWAWIMILERKSSIPSTPLDFYFLAYLVVGINSMVFSGERAMPVIFSKRILLIPIVYLIAANVSTRRALGRLLITLAVVMAVVSTVGIQEYLSGLRGLEGRLELFHHYMTSGGILMILGLMAFSFAFLAGPLLWRVVASASGLLMVLPLIFTFTRSSWLGFVVGLSLIAFVRSWKAVVGVAVLALLIVLVLPASFKDRALSVADPSHRHNIERVYMWKAGVEIIRDHPFAGVGDADLAKWYDRYKPAESVVTGGHLHNNLIMFGATLGIPGLLVFLVLSMKILLMEWGIVRSIPGEEWLLKCTAVGCLASYIGFQVNGLFEWNFGDAEIAMLLWLSVGLTLAVARIFGRESSSSTAGDAVGPR